jgi:hypothetical protein
MLKDPIKSIGRSLSDVLCSNTYTFLDKLELDIGVVGPLSFAEEVQKGWHSMFGLHKPKGWDNQLENKPKLDLFSTFGANYVILLLQYQ